MKDFTWLIHFCTLIGLSWAGLHEKRLLKYLFDPTRPDAHNPIERPSEVDTEALTVSVKFFLNQVMDVHEKNQVLTTIIWTDFSWQDYHFRWDPMDYGNVSVINLPYTAVWRPDILLYNCADEKFDRTFPTNVVMRYDGKVQWMPPGLFTSTCNIDISWFPFDVQNCTLKFGSWTYNGDQIDFRITCEPNDTSEDCWTRGEVDLSEYSNNGEFHLDGAYVVRFAQRYDCCQYDFIDIKMTIQLQRRALYYVFNLIVPCLLISGMSLMVFMLPPDAGEKISLGVTILLSLTMFLQLVADKLPQTSEAIPLIGIYFCCTMIMCSLSIVFTVLVLNYHHRSAEIVAVPHWIKLVVNTYLARLMFMDPPQRSRIVVPDDDEESLNSVGQLFKEAELPSSPDPYQESPEAAVPVIVAPTPNTNVSRAAAGGGGRGVNIGWDGVRKGKKSGTAAPASLRTGINGTTTTGTIRQNTELGSTTQRDQMQDRSSRSLLANVLDLEDDFRASALVPVYQWSDETAPVTPSSMLPYPRHKRVDDTSEPPPYSFTHSGTSPYSGHSDEPDVLCPDGLSDISANGATSPGSHTEEPKKNTPVSPALLSAYRIDLEQIVTELRFITSKIRDNEQEALVSLEWKFSARVIDRFCLIFFGALNIFAAATILFSAPNLIASFKP